MAVAIARPILPPLATATQQLKNSLGPSHLSYDWHHHHHEEKRLVPELSQLHFLPCTRILLMWNLRISSTFGFILWFRLIAASLEALSHLHFLEDGSDSDDRMGKVPDVSACAFTTHSIRAILADNRVFVPDICGPKHQIMTTINQNTLLAYKGGSSSHLIVLNTTETFSKRFRYQPS